MFAGILDLRTGMLEYCNAGHEPPFSQAPGGEVARYPIAAGPPLCVLPDYEYVTEYHQMLRGEWLCVVTDGVTEAVNPKNELYGSERVRIALQSIGQNATAEEIVAALRDGVGAFAGHADAADDLTLLAMRWTGPATVFSVPSSPD
jgi:adenylate cyclase